MLRNANLLEHFGSWPFKLGVPHWQCAQMLQALEEGSLPSPASAAVYFREGAEGRPLWVRPLAPGSPLFGLNKSLLQSHQF